MDTASLGTSNVRLPKPSFTYTKTLSNLPPSTTTPSAVFVPLQAGSWLMSIFAALGAVPAKLTVPLTLAAVAGSIGVAAGAGAAAVLGAAVCSSGFLLHAVSRTRPTTAHRPRVIKHSFRFMISLHLSWNWVEILAIILLPAARPHRWLVHDRGRIAPSAATGWLCSGRSSLRTGLAAPHGSGHTALLFRSELENIIHEQPGVILIIPLECGRRRSGEHPVVVQALEQTGGHRCTRTDGLWINDPAFNPVRLQTVVRQKKIGRRGSSIMRSIAGRVTLQARRRAAGEQAACHVRFLRRQRRRLVRNIRKGLPREGGKEAHQLAQFVFREAESGHPHLEIRAHAVAIGIALA